MPTEQLDEETLAYSRLVGDRLRAIRRQKRLSLHAVEDGSKAEFKASVLGAYERGERAISLPRLRRLAAFYEVPVDRLLPVEGDRVDGDLVIDLTEARRARPSGGLAIDLAALADLHDEAGEMLQRFVRGIQLQRQDFNGRMLTIRRDDARAVACILQVDAVDVEAELQELGLSRVPA